MFDISADHGKYRKTHTKFVNLLLSKGYVTQPGGRFKTMTNMEYRTKALEERDPGSQAKIDRMTKEIQEHANQSVSKSKQDYPTNLPAPVDDCYTAVPMAAFGKLVKGDGEGETALQEVKNAIDPTVYYQTTTGVLPSEVPELFTEAAADIGKTNPAKTSRANVSKTILELAVTMAANVCAQGTHAPLFARFTPGEIGALKGWMTLVAQYLLAYQVEVTGYAFREEPKLGNKLVRYGGTGKNMVAYLSKTPLVNTIAALPPAVRPNVKDGPDKEKWVTLFGNLLLESEKSSFDIPTKLGLSDYAGQNFYDSTGNNPKVIKHDEIFGDRNPRQWLSWTLQGVSVFHVMTGNELTLDAEQDKPTPALTVKGEEAIPLEDRKSQSKQSFGRARDVDKIDRTIKQEWKRAVDRRLASTRDRAEFDELRVKADSFVNKFSTDLDNLTLLKRFEEDFAKIEIDPVDVEKEKQKLDKLIQDCGTQADEAFERAKPILNGKIDDLKTHVTSESDQVSIGELEKRSRQIYDAYNENLYRKINCLKACIELHEQIMQQIETSFENLRKSVIEKSQSISKDKLTESVKGPIKKKYERILTAGPSIQGIKDLKALLERLDL
jgi:hypothetical protein